MSDIDLIPVSGLSGMNFFIPSYQRGYRWTERQVKDLLNDINEFDPKGDSYYCLQPVVVKQKETDEQILSDINGKDNFKSLEEEKESLQGEWEVIDGQQRLTTISLILKFLGKSLYKLRYATREGSETFLDKVGSKDEDKAKAAEKEEGENIDYHHIWEAYKCVAEWFGEHGDIKDIFAGKLLNGTKFIWYETEEDPVEVFTRINMWKIPLTNGELVKALFLNRMNFGKDEKVQRLKQQEIATQWDEIEYALRDDNFWFFFNQGDYKGATCIDAILDIMCERDKERQEKYEKGEMDVMDGSDLGVIRHIKNNLDPDIKGKDDERVDNVLGKKNDKYRTFRYFYYYFKEMSGKSQNANEVAENSEADTEKEEWIGERGWKIIKGIFQTLKDWYDDIECYHYVSFLVAENGNNSDGKVISDLLREWEGSDGKKEFIGVLIDKIKAKIAGYGNLSKPYEIDGPDKTVCRPLLLLYNVQTVINQDISLKKKYGDKYFTRFPFHIYKNEDWHIEHIDSNTENNLDDFESQKYWLANVFNFVEDEQKSKITDFINKPDKGKFKELKKELCFKTIKDNGEEKEMEWYKEPQRLSEDEKNQIMNFTLLDKTTNISNSNSVFSQKRCEIIDKDESMKTISLTMKDKEVDFKRELNEGEGGTSFIPPCTRNVFLKYYSPVSTDPNYWTKEDAEAYKYDIYVTLKKFGVSLDGKKTNVKEENSNEQK